MIYFDNNATTRVAKPVLDQMYPYLDEFYGNPSSAYPFAEKPRTAVRNARKSVAELLGASRPSEIVFTSGGTESDNWAIFGALEADRRKTHVITTRVEHEAVRKVCEKLERNGFEITWIDVDENGHLDIDTLKNSLKKETAIVSVMLANNETGVLFPVGKIAEIVRSKSDAVMHVDGVNAVGKILIDLKTTEIDLFSISGHKFHGPKGVGALYIRDGVDFPSLKIGGGQESGRRAGTEAIHQIAGIGEAARLVSDLKQMEKVRHLRDKLESEILKKFPFSRLNGDKEIRLPNTSNVSFENLNGEVIVAGLSELDVCVSTGSACNEELHQASPVLTAMDVPYSFAMGSVRFSLGRFNTEEEVDFVLEKLPIIIEDLQRISI